MVLIRKAPRRAAPVVLFVLLLASPVVGPSVRPASGHIGEAPFSSVAAPVGVAATPGRLLVTTPFCGNPRQVLSIDSTGAARVFATLSPRDGGCFEEYIAVAAPADPTRPGFPSPTRGGFPSNYAYVTQGQNVVQIALDGTVSPFAVIPACEPSRNGITFDDAGLFGYNMIVACANGKIYRVTAAGVTSLITDVADRLGLKSVRIENPDVAPMAFAPYGGHLFVAAELLGKVLAISPAGDVAVVASWAGAEGVHFVPAQKCDFGTSGGTFFTALKGVGGPGGLIKFPMAAFAGKSGRALVTSETGAGIGLLTPTGAPVIVPTLFHENIGRHEGSAFVDCTTPLLLRIIVKPGSIPHTINPKSSGTVPVAILSSPIFNALTQVVTSSITFGMTGIERSLASCNRSGQDVNGDGLLDMTCHFFATRLGITTNGVYRGPLILKLKYTAPGGDPDGEGAD
ncbi:MAG: hypothetical protein QN168_06500 [Armatimonadota bacterium]|nr:hypothetical protein [Armatimonadota bacterium]